MIAQVVCACNTSDLTVLDGTSFDFLLNPILKLKSSTIQRNKWSSFQICLFILFFSFQFLNLQSDCGRSYELWATHIVLMKHWEYPFCRLNDETQNSRQRAIFIKYIFIILTNFLSHVSFAPVTPKIIFNHFAQSESPDDSIDLSYNLTSNEEIYY